MGRMRGWAERLSSKLGIAVVILLVVTGCWPNDEKKGWGEWEGTYFAGQELGRSAGGSYMFLEFKLNIQKKDGQWSCEYSEDGWQTMVRVNCSVETSSNIGELIFESYADDDLYSSERYKKGHMFATMIRKSDDVILVRFSGTEDRTNTFEFEKGSVD